MPLPQPDDEGRWPWWTGPHIHKDFFAVRKPSGPVFKPDAGWRQFLVCLLGSFLRLVLAIVIGVWACFFLFLLLMALGVF